MSNITFLVKSTDFNTSSQIEEIEFTSDVVEYYIRPLLLSKLAKNSSLVKGIIKKTIWWINTKLISTNCKDLKSLEKIKRTLVSYWTANLFTNWNAWFEVIKNNKWEIVKLMHIITDTIRLLPWWEWAVQKIWSKEVFFNIFESDADLRKKNTEDYKTTKAKKDKLTPTLVGWRYLTGYNPNLNDVILVKDINIDSKYYWEALIESLINKILLLHYIDDFFIKFFERWTIKSLIFCDKSWKMTKTDKKLLRAEFEAKAKWIKRAFNTLMVSWDLDHIVVDSEFSPDTFKWMKEHLREDIVAGLNIPYDIVFTDKSNKASIQIAKQLFFEYTINPLQEIFIDVLKDIEIFNWNHDSDVEFEVIDTKDTLEESKTLTGLKAAWIITANEARELSNYELEPILWWEDLEVSNNSSALTPEDKQELLKKIHYGKIKWTEIFEWY